MKNNESLFKIGEIAKIVGITRKTLLVFEESGLLTPAFKDSVSGYRYYSADNITQIRAIRSLQTLGLTLKEIKEYYCDLKNVDTCLQRLTELRDSIDRNIELLQIRSTKCGDLTIRKTTLPKQVCFCEKHQCTDVKDAANKLRNVYINAVNTGKISMLNRMFTMRMSKIGEPLCIMCCIPVDESFNGEERIYFPETPALCIYFRGSYENSVSAISALSNYLKENNIKTTGPFRSVYLEGPPNRGKNSNDYITQIAVPIEE